MQSTGYAFAILTADWKRGSGKRRMWCLTPLNLSYRCLAIWWENTVLQQALWRALEAHPKILRAEGSLIALHRHDDLQELELKGGEVIRAKLVISADGANSQVRQMAGIGVHAWRYAQSCMLISVSARTIPATAPGSNLLGRTACVSAVV